MIYRDFDHWWSEGKHGYSSASREYAKEIWDDLSDTIHASLTDHKRAYLALATEVARRNSNIVRSAIRYAEECQKYTNKEIPGFWRWCMDQVLRSDK